MDSKQLAVDSGKLATPIPGKGETVIQFEDNGQDFLWWKIDDKGKVIDCGPFQQSVWTKCKVMLDTVVLARYPAYAFGRSKKFNFLKHRIIKVARENKAGNEFFVEVIVGKGKEAADE